MSRRVPAPEPAASSRDAAASTLTPGVRLGALHVEALLGRGGLCEVWGAEAPNGRKVAIKALQARWRHQPGAADLLRREYALLHRFRHPHIVSVLDLVEHDEQLLLVMEYLDGGDLVALARSHPRHWIGAAHGVAEALLHLSAQAFAHGDVKARNVLLGADERARLIDFSTAAPAGARALHGRTPAHLPPEADTADDGYAFAVLLYELLSGRLPFGSDGVTRVRARPPLDGLEWHAEAAPRALAAAVMRVLQARPEAHCAAPVGSLSALRDVIESVIGAYPRRR